MLLLLTVIIIMMTLLLPFLPLLFLSQSCGEPNSVEKRRRMGDSAISTIIIPSSRAVLSSAVTSGGLLPPQLLVQKTLQASSGGGRAGGGCHRACVLSEDEVFILAKGLEYVANTAQAKHGGETRALSKIRRNSQAQHQYGNDWSDTKRKLCLCMNISSVEKWLTTTCAVLILMIIISSSLKSMWKPEKNGNKWQHQCMNDANNQSTDQTLSSAPTIYFLSKQKLERKGEWEWARC